MPDPLAALDESDIARAATETISHYERSADSFWEGTKDHDVTQNIAALLSEIRADPPLAILDLGCGPGRDLKSFRQLGHQPVGLDGAPAFVRMARQHSGCEVFQQDLLALDLPADQFHGVFANAVLFHVPSQELPRVLLELRATLRPGGVLFASNPRGPDVEEWRGERYGSYLSFATWRSYLSDAGFDYLEHYYRPTGRPRAKQPWLASLWRKPL